ncbi:succinate dehydrogenase, hydrophobic membrane anchor protein [Mariprofundus erugo]|uniref:Succinate dehydrogenase hydrophobic membrane anchor subunit n=1 Tax=Mariprofundus erugo TaxID=2528639 RepID=A0A5R9GGC4_9PROT|nr:succinate dehydrogenase, hydrophobic membrane anchor protein [Mariprofundus erugo]TLS65971.1 succinate dehydrogenase, hydrophobic membrane anchor protein [Mariprofundus erugo]
MKLIKEPGSARSGFRDWYLQRLSAVVLAVLLPLSFVVLILVYTGHLDQFGLLDIVDNFVSRLLHTILIIALIVHAYMGLKVMIEDYVPVIGWRVSLIGGMLVLMSGFGIWWLAIIWAWGG